MDIKNIASSPVFFEKNRVFRVYLGGKLFSEFFGDNSEDSFYPEEWICSSTKALNEGSTDPFEGLSTVKDTDIHFNELLEKEKELMLGNAAIARGAYEAGVRVVASYPGTPSTEITENIVKYDEIYAE